MKMETVIFSSKTKNKKKNIWRKKHFLKKKKIVYLEKPASYTRFLSILSLSITIF